MGAAMKPELKALWQAIMDTPTGDPNGIHWREDELWCGPFKMGEVWDDPDAGCWQAAFGGISVTSNHHSEAAARAALEAAAQEQIKTWFKE